MLKAVCVCVCVCDDCNRLPVTAHCDFDIVGFSKVDDISGRLFELLRIFVEC